MDNTQKKNLVQILSADVSVHYFYISINQKETRNQVLQDIFNQVKQNENFSLGEYQSEEKLLVDLDRKIFGESDFKALQSFTEGEYIEIKSNLENTISKSFETLKTESDITVYVIPFCNELASKDLNGVNAFPVEGNILYLFIDTKHPQWRRSLVETVPHEYAHLVYTSRFEWNSILDGFVNEGLAEKFREYLVGGDVAPWSKALPKKEALQELSEISEEEVLNLYVDDSNVDFYIAHFFGTGELPNWYGYSIGYWLVEEVINVNNISLLDLFEKSPKEILGLWKKSL